jgi:hypothetical protein
VVSAVIFKVDVPRIIDFVSDPLVIIPLAVVMLKLAVLKVPCIKKIAVAVVLFVYALPKVTVIPAPLIVNVDRIVMLFVVIVELALTVKAPVAFHVVVADKVILPEMVNWPEEVSVQVAPVVVRLWHTKTPVKVIVGEPEDALIITASAAVGTDAPPGPPDVVDQLVVDEVFQVPVPPRQYLSAI